jgi:gluconate 2-dehydrogenase gamma chain
MTAPARCWARAMADVSRRELIKASDAIGANTLPIAFATDAGAAPQHEHGAPVPSNSPAATGVHPQTRETTCLPFNSDEATFIEAAVARLIPKDDSGAARSRRCPEFRQTNGRRMGRWRAALSQRPWQPGTPSQGYQLPFTPAELFLSSLAAYCFFIIAA